MAGTVFCSVTMSLDGFIAPEGGMDEPVRSEPTKRVTHLTYAVRAR